jgi:dihydrolipoamide dehydrogenase
LQADICLGSIRRRPYAEGLNLEALGLEVDQKGRVVIDSEYRTSIPHIQCIGDVAFGVITVPFLASYTRTPKLPGLARQSKKSKSPALNTTSELSLLPPIVVPRQGMVKFISDKETDRVLGVHIIGPNAGEMIAKAVLAMEYGASLEDIASTTHAHPTLSEAFKEAAMVMYSKVTLNLRFSLIH